jgi:hypothetical protein
MDSPHLERLNALSRTELLNFAFGLLSSLAALLGISFAACLICIVLK